MGRTPSKFKPEPEEPWVGDVPNRNPLTAIDRFEPPVYTKRAKQKDPEKIIQPPYYCTTCNREYPEQDRNFFRTKSSLYSANNGYVTICRSCADAYYRDCVGKLRGNERLALKHMARLFDWYVTDEAIEGVLSNPNIKHPVGGLAQKINRANYPEGTSLTTLIEMGDDEEEVEEEDVAPNLRGVEIFGLNHNNHEYDILLQHYDMLIKLFPDRDNMQEVSLRDLCETKLLQIINRDNPKNFREMTELYNTILKNSGLQTRSMQDANPNTPKEALGMWISQIEHYTPAEIIKDDTLYKDVDGVESYINRFILRPIRNFITGDREMDPEYSLTEEEKQT